MDAKKAKSDRLLVAVLGTNVSSGRGVMRGLLSARLDSGFTLETIDIARTGRSLVPFKSLFRRAAGVVVRGSDMVEKVVPYVSPDTPVVAVDIGPDELGGGAAALPWAYVGCDQRRVGASAAEELLATGRRHFAFVPMLRRYVWTRERGEAFAERIREAGREVRLYEPRSAWSWIDERASLAEFLSAMPRPFGIFAGNDLLAKLALDACKDAGIKVPREAAIVGADNDDTICFSSLPSLSSVRIDFEGAGRRAAAELASLVGTKRPASAYTIQYGVYGVVRRGSTAASDFATDPRLEAGLDFIALQFVDPLLGVPDVAAAMGVGSRQAERLFRATGKTIRRHVEDRRIDEACALLATTRSSVKAIAGRCGFSSDIYFSAVFHRRFGCSPGRWRAMSSQENGGADQ